jgi:SAM-dependent methyltransferase
LVQSEKIIDAGAAGEEARIHAAYARRAAMPRRYSLFDPGQLFTLQQLERRLLATLRREGLTPLDGRKILEIGCGNGYWLTEFIKWGAAPKNLTGIDLLKSRLAEARSRCPEEVRLEQGNAVRLDFPPASFDVVFQATVFTSILEQSLKIAVAHEMLRLLKPDGVILWYDFRFDNPRNPDVRGIESAEIGSVFPGCEVKLERVTLAPPLARRLAPLCWSACELLEKIPWLCSHYLGIIRKFKVQGSKFKV